MTVPEKLRALLDAAIANDDGDMKLIVFAIPLADDWLRQHEALIHTNCRRVEQSGFVAAVCLAPEQGTGPDDLRGPLPKEQWCDRCAALDDSELEQAMEART